MRESLSALMDGEISAEELDRLLPAVKKDATLKTSYDAWQIASVACKEAPILPAGFSSRFAEKLAAEPVVLAPHRIIPAARRKPVLWGIAASALVATVVIWHGVGNDNAQVPALTPVVAPQAVAVKNHDALEEYLGAHRSMISGPTMQKDLHYASYQPGQAS